MAGRQGTAGRESAERLIFGDLDGARKAVETCTGAVTLVTAPFAAAACGPLYLWRIVEILRAESPGRDIDAVIDCGGEAGLVLAALDIGWRRLRFSGEAGLAAKLADIAGQYGAVLEAHT